jgi:hypothetical protein
MSPTTTNELLQWIALAALFLFILALYRQVGLMLVDRRTYLVGSFGPNVGQKAQRQLLAPFPSSPDHAWKLLVFVQERCSACADLVEQLKDWRTQPWADFGLALVGVGAPEYLEELRAAMPAATVVPAATVLDDGITLAGQSIGGYPFAILMDADGTVRAKSIGADATPVLEAMGGRLPMADPHEHEREVVA